MPSRKVLTDYDFSGVSRILNLPDAVTDQEPVNLSQLRGYFVERRHEWVDPYDYLGKAPINSSESESVWEIVRLTISFSGSVIESLRATGVNWTDRFNHTYT